MGGSLEAITAALLSRVGEADVDPTLDRIRPVLEVLGEPQRCAPVIHITGTNGKTSTARMVESLLRALGLRTGLYTSPHLVSITERIRIDGEPLDEDRFAALYGEVAPLIDLVDAREAASGHRRLSFFEAVTALAFAAFADAPVDVMILEVGMGGTWDATNLADGAVAVVTPIGLEFGVVSRAVAVGGQSVTLQGLRGRYDEVFLPLFGAHQAGNAALALAAVEALVGTGEALSDELVRQGFADASSPGRLEVLRSSPSVILDAAHNPAGGGVLAEALQDSFSFAGVVGVLAVLADKDVEGLLEALEPVLDHVVCTANTSPRALPAQRLADLAEPIFGGHRIEVADDLATAIDQAMAWADEHSVAGPTGVVVTGSVVTVGAARALLRGGS